MEKPKKDQLIQSIDESLLCENCIFSPVELFKAAEPIIKMAVTEDIPIPELIDSKMILDSSIHGAGKIIAKSRGVLAGGWLIEEVILHYNPELKSEVLIRDGEPIAPGQTIATIYGALDDIVISERVILNFLSRLSGVATMTSKYVQACKGTNAIITGTRKTLPAYRFLDKYAVQCGGGDPHRMGLSYGVMIKDNHIAALQNKMTISEIVARVKSKLKAKRKKLPIWVEVDTLDQLRQTLPATPDIILLDNMSTSKIVSAIKIRNRWFAKSGIQSETPQPLLEASGGIDLHNVAEIAQTGVDRIAVGALTHSVIAVDVSLDLSTPKGK